MRMRVNLERAIFTRQFPLRPLHDRHSSFADRSGQRNGFDPHRKPNLVSNRNQDSNRYSGGNERLIGFVRNATVHQPLIDFRENFIDLPKQNKVGRIEPSSLADGTWLPRPIDSSNRSDRKRRRFYTRDGATL